MKTKQLFSSPYLGIDTSTYSHVFTTNGDYSVIIRMQNPVLQFAADHEAYAHYHQLMDNIINILGPGHTIQKLDIFHEKKFIPPNSPNFLDQHYYTHFEGRRYSAHTTYLTITKSEKRNRFFASDPKAFEIFLTKVEKIITVLEAAKCVKHALEEAAIKQLIRQLLTLHFDETPVTYHNLECTTDHIRQGTSYIKSNTLIDIDQINLPSTLHTTTNIHEPGFPLPVDMMHFLSNISGYQSMVYHQVITIPNQEAILNKLRMKRKRHISIPDPANMLSVKDIDAVLEDIARDNRILVHAHYNILIKATQEYLSQATNHIESQLFKLGIIPSANDSNQLELFRTILPGNTGELKPYNQFLTSSDAAICLMYKERYPINEDSSFQIHLTDRKGIPIAIDTNDQPLHQGRINNRNKFVLGPSGSGKSFFMNHLVRQYYQYDMDIVLVDTGHSYEGLCHYYNGQYITYSEDRPITMNPFNITRVEFNEEKREFLKALIGLLWKGADGTLSQIEDTMLSKVIHQYYEAHWKKKISNLNFNTFYEFSNQQIAEIAKAENIPFDLETYRFVLKKFYKGGHYEPILNQDMEASLFDAPFIVFEIDAIKEPKPIMAYPKFEEPMYTYLQKLSQDFIIPNIREIPENTMTLLENNQMFIEAYMAGLNHEMSCELLWREFPTDQRGSYFRNFWDDKDSLSVNNDSDILEMHEWEDQLGEHNQRIINDEGEEERKKNYIVLVIRGDLLKKYPNTVIYAQKALPPDGGSGPRKLSDLTDINNIKTPIFQGELEPDIVMLGFNLTRDEAEGVDGDPGWFFVIQERPGQIHFGLDDYVNPDPLNNEVTIPPNDATTWNELSWGHLVPTDGNLDNLNFLPLNYARANVPVSPAQWGRNSAEMAYILYQNPAIFARHASEMLPENK